MNTIIFFLPSFRGGGAERVMVSLANKFSQEGFNVVILVCQADGPYRKLVLKDVQIVELATTRTSWALPKLVLYLWRSSPEVILSTMPHANVVISMAHMLAFSKSHLFLREANVEPKKKNNIITDFFVNLLGRLFYSRAQRVIAVSDSVAKCVITHRGVNADSVVKAYNPVVDDALLSMSNQAPQHPWLEKGQVKNNPVILAAGRLTHAKGFDNLIHALSLLENKNVRLLILGEGAGREALNEIIVDYGLGSRVSMPGFVDNPFSYMKRSSVFVLSSRWEGLPNTLIQAMACGAPVISTDCPGGSSEILEGGVWGKLVPVDNPGALAEAIQQTLEDDNHPDVVRRAQDFTVEASLQRYMQIMGLSRASQPA
ncbi:glycosyltransferase [Halomonas sp. BC04]|uniref:glycosyltransferase n=1 Tax=Halomonas sp. BC04 TaxID=1403540 RepID=UPI0009DF6956|nr:glycosyltransferase [Halomonas sp. BC04]